MKITDMRKETKSLTFANLSLGNVFEFKHNIYIKIDNNNFYNAFCLSEDLSYSSHFEGELSVLLVEAHLFLKRNI